MKIDLNENTTTLSYSLFNPLNITEVRTALIKNGNLFSLRINANGVNEEINNESFDDVVRWTFGAEKNATNSIFNSYNETLDNVRFYQKALTLEEYLSIISVDF